MVLHSSWQTVNIAPKTVNPQYRDNLFSHQSPIIAFRKMKPAFMKKKFWNRKLCGLWGICRDVKSEREKRQLFLFSSLYLVHYPLQVLVSIIEHWHLDLVNYIRSQKKIYWNVQTHRTREDVFIIQWFTTWMRRSVRTPSVFTAFVDHFRRLERWFNS